LRINYFEALGELAKIADAEQLTAILDEQEFVLDQVGQAHDHLTSGQATGKVVVSI